MQFNFLFVFFALLLVAEAARGRAGRGRGSRGGRGGRGGKGGCRPMAGGVVLDCGNNRDAFKIEKIILRPKKPVAGKMLDIQLVGTLRETITPGATTSITAKYGFINVLDIKKDVCKLAVERKTGYKCPVKPQRINVHHKLKIPSFAPSGKYKINAIGHTKNKRRIFKIVINANI